MDGVDFEKSEETIEPGNPVIRSNVRLFELFDVCFCSKRVKFYFDAFSKCDRTLPLSGIGSQGKYGQRRRISLLSMTSNFQTKKISILAPR